MINLTLPAGQFSLEHAIAFREQLTAMLDGYHDRSTHGGGYGPNVYPRIGALTYAIRLIEDQIRTHAPDRAHAMGLFDGQVTRGGLFDAPATVVGLTRPVKAPGRVLEKTADGLPFPFDEEAERPVVEALAGLGINLRA